MKIFKFGVAELIFIQTEIKISVPGIEPRYLDMLYIFLFIYSDGT